MNKPIRILQVVTIMDLGGLENFLMTIYRNIDRSQIQFDFLVHRQERGVFDDEIERMGGKIFRLNPIRPTRFFSYQNELKSFFKEHKEYRIVHSHINENSALVLNIAKKMGIPTRIAHSHAKTTAKPYKALRNILKRNVHSNATHSLACSVEAGHWLYNQNKFDVFKNSVNVNRFKYPNKDNNVLKLKSKLGFSKHDFVIGLIARFSPVKNHDFLIDVFHEYHKMNNNSKLLLVGEGELKEQIKNKVNFLGIENYVVFTGNVNNPEDYLSAMNLFIMTSFSEGMPVVLVEAQCNGLPVLMSDAVPDEVILTDLIYKESLDSSEKTWVNKIELIKKTHEYNKRDGYGDVIISKGFDIETNSEKLVDLYLSEHSKALKDNS